MWSTGAGPSRGAAVSRGDGHDVETERLEHFVDEMLRAAVERLGV